MNIYCIHFDCSGQDKQDDVTITTNAASSDPADKTTDNQVEQSGSTHAESETPADSKEQETRRVVVKREPGEEPPGLRTQVRGKIF